MKIQRYGPDSTCSVDECVERPVSKSLCKLHYGRMYKLGSTDAPRKLTYEERFEQKFKVDENGCWIWTAHINACGYGLFRYEGAMQLAHRVSYMLNVGAIPDGKEIDHRCRVRECVNPEHLEPVDHIINVQRARTPTNRSTGVLGVNKRGPNSYRAVLSRDGVILLRKNYRTIEEAHRALEELRAEYDGDFGVKA